MPRRRSFATLAAAVLISLLGLLGVAQPAAAVTYEQKLAVLSSWTETSSTSYSAWLSGAAAGGHRRVRRLARSPTARRLGTSTGD